MGVSCHVNDDKPAGGLNFEDPASAAAALHGDDGWIEPGSPECSDMVLRVLSDDPFYRMPPAEKLNDQDACLLIQWVNAL